MKATATRVLVIFLLICCQSFAMGQTSNRFYLPASVTANDYQLHKMIIKIKPEHASKCFSSVINIPRLQEVFNKLGVSSVQKKFPQIKSADKKLNNSGQAYADLSLIYDLDFQSNLSIENAINQLLQTGDVVYAQPSYLVKPLDFIPNDPLNFNQYHLAIIQAYKAWDFYKGDTNTVIGIPDWGTDIDHPDLVNNIKYNHNDPIDGIDNDNDGYIDNFRGWDMGDNDNNPQGNITHGAFVDGMASAQTDNNIGLSGTGFLCKFLPIKICDSNNIGIRAYEGIVYAVEHGCSVVNCSWGDTFYTGPFGQDVIDYATINKGAMVVAACGNNNNTGLFFPAAYNYVLSVAGSGSTDVKWSGSSYGYTVDITAPGENVWSTYDGGTYGSSSGTSFASPIVSGCAALLRSRFPNLTGLQIGELIKVSADVIDTIPSNLPYKDLLGSGRVNMYKALFDTVHPSIKFMNQMITDADGNGYFTKNDTLIIKGDFLNYLAVSSSNLKVTMHCLSANTVMIDSVANLGVINTLQTINNNAQPFKVYLKPSLANNEELIFKLTFTDNNYRAVQYFYLEVNLNYLNIDTNRIATTLGSEGMIGYNDANSLQGLGFRFNHGETMLYMGGFIAGKSASQVSDAIYSATMGFDHDFHSLQNIHKINNPTLADYEAYGEFNDASAGANAINLLIKQHAFAWTTAPNDKFVIVQYTLINKDVSDINNLYAGLYMDWDNWNPSKNRISFDAVNKLGYCFSIDGGDYTGISFLSSGGYFHYGFDNDGANGSININDGFSDLEKYTTLKTARNDAGMAATGNNVSQLMSSGPYNLLPNDSVVLAFALIGGDNLSDLQNSASAALHSFYQTGIAENSNDTDPKVVLFQNQPNPFGQSTQISFYLSKDLNVELSFTDICGNTKTTVYSGNLSSGMHTFTIADKLSPGIYIYSLSCEQGCYKKKMCVVK